jgi:uncharacterized membrane protein YcaP (DUF421 family)
MRLMGKRQIGELDASELVSTLLVSEIVAIPIDDQDIPLITGVLAALFIFSIEIILSTVKNKSEKMKNAIEGNTEYIIYKGRLNQKKLRENRISVDELLSQMRIQGFVDIDQIYYAIIEKNGSLSLLKKDDPMAHAIIIDGEIIEETLVRQEINRKNVEYELSRKGLRLDDVFLMTVSDSGEIKTILKENET